MEIFVKLAVGASLLASAEAEGGGFGFNFDILESNLINLLVVYAILFYFGRGFLSKTLGDRKSSIAEAIKDVEQRKQSAAAALAEQQQKLAQAQAEADKIRSDALEAAAVTKAEILAKAEQDIQRMKEAAAQDMSSDQERVLNELRQRIAALALQKAEGDIQSRLDDDRQQRLIDRSIAMLGGS